MTKLIAVLTATAVMTLGGAGIAAAQADPGGEPGSSASQRAHPHLRRHGLRIATRAAAEAIGVTVTELRDAVRIGTTVAAVAESKGVNPDDVEQAIVIALTEAVDRAAAEGRVTEERAAKIKERIPTFAQRYVDHEWKARPEAATQPTSI
jgi:hypothetical protein